MENDVNFKICSDYRREDFDFSEIQKDRNNPLNSKGYPTYPFVLPSSDGSSYTYKLSDKQFFKRKLQDGDRPGEIFSMHHDNLVYNELKGSFDDLAEVISYILAKNIVDPKTNEPIVKVAKYALATYTDKEGHLLRGCVTDNVCNSPNETLVCMSDMLKTTHLKGNSIDVYMQALENYCKVKKINFDKKQCRQDLIKNSYFCWKISNSDNHKNNITFIIRKNNDLTFDLFVSPLLDNGSSYELSSPYTTNSLGGQYPRILIWLQDDEYGKTTESGERVFSFKHSPQMHNAFQLEPNTLMFKDTIINGKSYAYEYALASEILSDEKLFNDIYEIEKQFDLNQAISEIDSIYGAKYKDTPKQINWPPLLKEFMAETNAYKSRTLARVVAETYLNSAFSSCVGGANKDNPNECYNAFLEIIQNAPLLENKEAYDDLFVEIAKSFDIDIDKNNLKQIKFKLEQSLEKPENQPN